MRNFIKKSAGLGAVARLAMLVLDLRLSIAASKTFVVYL
jgi:hypothetical protein